MTMRLCHVPSHTATKKHKRNLEKVRDRSRESPLPTSPPKNFQPEVDFDSQDLWTRATAGSESGAALQDHGLSPHTNSMILLMK